ncbi:type I-E CRISPR-associated protein Cas6/Cse3/CasE [Streptococcus mutans]|nr:type I-E CRISPR-associated protein Cas6/Cse3/CasE [Streptococcus mutans]MCB5082608.1 type I-E CRISPR-associated protein Cas6/Cse3/CasE [Streptococcus mutans]MCB5085591.1 type I-E CRISPR-associated protein Cas6/Cse3/CasE [Streptococcus mutans]MCB5086422.1 type I-E CRISPR-associated protein Cas6/Cse3/CasE [Streptococcus mutans]
MYISRVEIDINNRRKIRNLTHVEAYHGWVEQSFPKELEQNIRTRKLWRVDTLQGKNYLIVISQDKPDLLLLEKYGVTGTAHSKSYDSFLDNLEKGDKMKFRVVLNPVISLSLPNSKERGTVKPHVTIEYQMKYLMDRSKKNGFLLKEDDFSIVERGYEVFKKSNMKPIRLIKAVYEGILTVNDVELFKKVLTEGIGKKKAYGFGMMTVIPLRN